jgi:dolichol-phosphate mannosyltransferase
MKKNLIFIPTYNEINNIDGLLDKIRNLYPEIDILVIDDNSSDGTVEFLKNISDEKIKYKIREKKYGIGSAHKDGINYAYENNYNVLITMDADGTHEPENIRIFLSLIEKYDIINTNRFLKKDSLSDWPLSRKIFTYTRFYLNKYLLNVNLDSSGAFRCYNLDNIKKDHFHLITGLSYSFFWESLFIFKEKDYKIFEIPINLPFRKNGSSKITMKDIIGSFFLILYFFLKRCVGNYK